MFRQLRNSKYHMNLIAKYVLKKQLNKDGDFLLDKSQGTLLSINFKIGICSVHSGSFPFT